MIYGSYHNIDVCQQSPVITQSSAPFRVEPIDGIGVVNLDLYNNMENPRLSSLFNQPKTNLANTV